MARRNYWQYTRADYALRELTGYHDWDSYYAAKRKEPDFDKESVLRFLEDFYNGFYDRERDLFKAKRQAADNDGFMDEELYNNIYNTGVPEEFKKKGAPEDT